MVRDAIVAVSVAALVVLAGCGGATNGTATPQPGTETSTLADTAGQTPTPGSDATGRLTVYISDQQNAIDRFEHLNATVTKVGIHRANATGNATDDGAGWMEYDVDNVTVDLTQLQGSKATRLTQFDVPSGTYTKVFVHVSDVHGTLKDGESTTVKLPSDRLQLTRNFRVGAGDDVDFVFDVSVVEAGRSGKFVLKPVVSESGPGTDVDITEINATSNPSSRRPTSA
jgi:hypothetical protein